jgi:hypothetical protein
MYYDRAGTQYLLRMIHVKAPSLHRSQHEIGRDIASRITLDTVAWREPAKPRWPMGRANRNGREGEKIVQMLHTNEPSTKPDGEWTAGACTT